ncbi:MAG TPA: trypsin-like peptidase domain-containing protein [Acidimicrobiales bacterium]|nr:trypsin-like peptidase domain-containing protein [Acidimicrobiales bacterium]
MRAAVVLACAVVLALAVALVVTNLRTPDNRGLSTSEVNAIVNQQVSTAIGQLEAQPPAAVSAYQAIRAGIVVVQSQPQRAARTEELGTGVVVDTQGDILTALHVVQGASRIEVTFADGTNSLANITVADPGDDIAVLTPERLPAVIVPAVLGPDPQVGDEAFVVGNPLGLVASLSAGVVSGLDRTFRLGPGRTLSGMIQFDAAVNPGSSGGPLLNTKGQVIGIVTGLANPAGTDNFAGIAFAVPISTAGEAAGAPPK